MALVVLCGIPQSGKSEVCDAIVQRLGGGWTGNRRVFVVKDGSYKSVEEEKITRAQTFAAVEREMNKDTLLIVDALNYIKVFSLDHHLANTGFTQFVLPLYHRGFATKCFVQPRLLRFPCVWFGVKEEGTQSRNSLRDLKRQTR